MDAEVVIAGLSCELMGEGIGGAPARGTWKVNLEMDSEGLIITCARCSSDNRIWLEDCHPGVPVACGCGAEITFTDDSLADMKRAIQEFNRDLLGL